MADQTIEEFQELWRRVREGSAEEANDAARELVAQNEESILRAIRRARGRRHRSVLDSVDIQQSVWRSFFQMRWNPDDLDTPEKLTAYLCAMARKKVFGQHRGLTAQKRDGGRQVSLNGSADEVGLDLPDRRPSQTDLVISEEQWNHVLKHHPVEHQQIATMNAEGCSCVKIGQALGIGERQVCRILSNMFQELLAGRPRKPR